MRSLHNHHPKIERGGETMNQAVLILIIIAAFGALFKYSGEDSRDEPQRTDRHERIGSLSERNYLLAVMAGGTEAKRAPKLSEEALEAMDRAASLQTRAEDVERLKPKARAAYYATLNGRDGRGSAFDAVDR